MHGTTKNTIVIPSLPTWKVKHEQQNEDCGRNLTHLHLGTLEIAKSQSNQQALAVSIGSTRPQKLGTMNHANISRRARRGGYADLMKAKLVGCVGGKIGKLPGFYRLIEYKNLTPQALSIGRSPRKRIVFCARHVTARTAQSPAKPPRKPLNVQRVAHSRPT